MNHKNILVVEEDAKFSALIQHHLERENLSCVCVKTGEEALQAIEQDDFDLVLLDVVLPKMDGFEVCRRLKQDFQESEISVVFLTGKSDESDRVRGFELGADDYIIKPFSLRELTLRIRAILRRKKIKRVQKSVLKAGRLLVDIVRHQILVDGRKVILTSMEFKLLAELITNRGRVCTRENLLQSVWNLEADLETRTVDTHIKRLRFKLGDLGLLIETVHGYGYRYREDK